MTQKLYRYRFSQLTLAVMLAGSGMSAYANDFQLVNNQFSIKNNTTLVADATVGSDGILTTSTLPQIAVTSTTLGLGLPSFEFNLGTSGLLTNTSHTFKVGLSISDNSSPTTRRFEAFIGELTLNVDGNRNVTGFIPSQNMNVAARQGSATFTADISNPSANGPVRISGNTLTFSGTDAVARLRARNNAVINALLDDFQLNGVFTFRVVVEEVSRSGVGAQPARVGVTSGSTFTAVPRISASCPPNMLSQVNNVFTLLTGTGFNSAYAVQGQFRAGTGGTANTLAAFTESCSVFSGIPAPVVNNATLNQGNQAAADLSSAISAGNTTQATTALNNVNTSLASILTQTTTTSATLSPAQQAQVLNTVETVFSNIDTLLTSATTQTAQANVVTTLNNILNSMISAGVAPSATLVNRVVEASRASASSALNRQFPNETPAQIGERINNDPKLLENTLRTSLRVPPVVVTKSPQAVVVSLQLVNDGVLPSQLLSNFNDTIKNDLTSAFGIATSRISIISIAAGLSALTTDRPSTVLAATVADPEILIDEASGTTYFILPTESYAGVLVSVKAVPTFVPNGLRFLPNGVAVLTQNGSAFELAPTAFDLGALAKAVISSNYTFSQRADVNAIRVNLGNGNRLAGVFAYDNLNGINLNSNCGTVSIANPVGALNSANYAFGINCSSNGVKQRLLPFVDHDNFFATLDAANLTYAVDRNTGIVSVTGVGRFKPDFFVLPLTAADTAFHATNKDAQDTAFMAGDFNADGKTDFKVIAPNGSQVLFGL